MKKRTLLMILMAVCFVLIACSAAAELSTNLFIRTTKVQKNQRLTDSETYVDAAGNTVVPSDKGYATKKYTYGTGNRVASETFLDANGAQVNSADGYCVKTYRYSLGRVTEIRYYDKDGKPVTGPEGYARQETKYNARRHISTWTYDADGKPVGVHRLSEYNKNGRVKAEAWYDAENRPADGPDGYARVEYQYFGRTKSKIAYTGADGKPFYNPKDKFAIMESVYSNGKIRSTHYYGSENELIPGPKGYAYVLYTYKDPYVTETYYNADGTLFYTEKGICGIAKAKLKGDRTSEYYLVGEGVRGFSTDGYSMTKTEYNRGRITKQGYYDDKDHLMVVPSLGYAQIINYYVAAGVYRTFYFGADGKRAPGPDGYAMVENSYAKRKLVSRTFYDTDKTTKVNCKDGYAQIRYENENGNPVSEKYFTADGKPCLVGGLYDEIRYTWNGRQKTGESYWAGGQKATGPAGSHEVRTEYNGNNREVKKTWLDENGKLTLCADGYAATETEYNSAGGVMSKKYYGADGNLTYTPGQQYAFTRMIPFRDLELLADDREEDEEEAEETEAPEDGEEPEEAEPEEEPAEEAAEEDGMVLEYHGLDGRLMNLPAGYAYIVREKNAKGFIAAEYYFDADGQPVNLTAGYAAVKKEYDDAGQAIAEIYCDADGNKIPCTGGYDEIRREYNVQKKIIREEYRLDGQPVPNQNGYAILKRDYDEAGQVAAESYYNEKEEPTASKAGYHRVERTWHAPGRAASEAWFDIDGQPTGLNGNPYVKVEKDYDEAGNPAVERYYDAAGNAAAMPEGYDELRKTYNEKRQVVRLAYYLSGEPTETSRGYAILTREYDEAGLVIAENCFDTAGEPVVCAAGYHRVERTWLDPRHMGSEAWFGTDGQPMLKSGNTYFKYEREYDEAGNPAVERYYGADGEKAARTEGYDEIRRVYNEVKQVIRTDYYLNGERAVIPQGYAVVTREYNENGQVTAENCFGTDEEPVLCVSGYHRMERTWGEDGRVAAEAWFGTDGKPVEMGNNTYVRREREYDEAGNVTVERYYGADGNPAAVKEGYDEVRKEYNEQKLAVRTEYRLGGSLKNGSKGYAVTVREYTPEGYTASESYYGENEEPAMSTAGYHRIERTWLDKDHAASEAWFDTDGKPMTLNGKTYVKVEREFDEAGNTAAERYYGPDGEKAACKDGYDEIHRVYNEKKQAVRFAYFLGGEPFTMPRGYSVMTREYDEAGLVAAESYFDTDGTPVPCTAGYHRVEKTWADKNHAASEAWFGTDGAPIATSNSYVKVEREYDENWNTVTERYYGPDGAAAACKDGYDEIHREYNEKKQAVRFAYFLGGEPFVMPRGYSVMTREYDEAGLTAAENYFDADGTPLLCTAGYHRTEKTWADKNHAASEAWFDTEGKPVVTNNTYVKVEREYDASWNVTAERYYGPDGAAAACKDGYDEIHREYNEAKQVTRFAYFLGGEPFVMPKGYAAMVREYDADGYVAAESYYGGDGEPVLCSSGYQRIERTWYDKDHAKTEAWFGTDGEPITRGNTYVKVEREYDESWNAIVERYYGPDGEKIPCRDGYDEVHREFNEKKQIIRFAYFLNGEPFVMPAGYSVMRREYDENGFTARQSYFDADEVPVLCAAGYHAFARTWYDKDHVKTEMWFGMDGEPVTTGNTYYGVEREYDEAWNVKTERYLDADGKPAARSEGYDEVRRTYNEMKKPVRFEYYLGGEPYVMSKGYTVMEREYNEDGSVKAERFFDAEGKEIVEEEKSEGE